MLLAAVQIELQNGGMLAAAASRLAGTSRAFASNEIVSIMHTFTTLRYTPAKKAGMYQIALATLLAPHRRNELNTQVRTGRNGRCADAA